MAPNKRTKKVASTGSGTDDSPAMNAEQVVVVKEEPIDDISDTVHGSVVQKCFETIFHEIRERENMQLYLFIRALNFDFVLYKDDQKVKMSLDCFHMWMLERLQDKELQRTLPSVQQLCDYLTARHSFAKMSKRINFFFVMSIFASAYSPDQLCQLLANQTVFQLLIEEASEPLKFNCVHSKKYALLVLFIYLKKIKVKPDALDRQFVESLTNLLRQEFSIALKKNLAVLTERLNQIVANVKFLAHVILQLVITSEKGAKFVDSLLFTLRGTNVATSRTVTNLSFASYLCGSDSVTWTHYQLSNCALDQPKWADKCLYFEVQRLTIGFIKIGIAPKSVSAAGEILYDSYQLGVFIDNNSNNKFDVDVEYQDYKNTWRHEGVIVGVWIDVAHKSIQFYQNGKKLRFKNHNSTLMDTFHYDNSEPQFPTISLWACQQALVRIKPKHWKYSSCLTQQQMQQTCALDSSYDATLEQTFDAIFDLDRPIDGISPSMLNFHSASNEVQMSVPCSDNHNNSDQEVPNCSIYTTPMEQTTAAAEDDRDDLSLPGNDSAYVSTSDNSVDDQMNWKKSVVQHSQEEENITCHESIEYKNISELPHEEELMDYEGSDLWDNNQFCIEANVDESAKFDGPIYQSIDRMTLSYKNKRVSLVDSQPIVRINGIVQQFDVKPSEYLSSSLKAISNKIGASYFPLDKPDQGSVFPLMFISNGLADHYFICPTNCEYLIGEFIIYDQPHRDLILENKEIHIPIPLYGYIVTIHIRSNGRPVARSFNLNSDYGALQGQFECVRYECDSTKPDPNVSEYVQTSFHCDSNVQEFNDLIGSIVNISIRSSNTRNYFCAREITPSSDRSKLRFRTRYNLDTMNFKVNSLFKYGPYYYGEECAGLYRCTKIKTIPHTKDKYGNSNCVIYCVRVASAASVANK